MKTVCLCLALLPLATLALDNGLGRTPAMGYNTWNDFRCDGISAFNITRVADRMAELQLHRVGYEYLNIDDCWAVDRDNTTGVIIPDPVAFPEGMKAVADYVHSKGFKFGIYTDRGTMTCARRPGSQGFEAVDAQTYAEWGVDYLKEDSCYAPSDHPTAVAQYALMRDELNKTGRAIYFSLCGWEDWYAEYGWDLGNSWRISGDVNLFDSAIVAWELDKKLSQYARPGGWNDPDMLVGTSESAAVHLSQDQSRTQFSLWSILAAPLLIGSSMLDMNSFDYQTYTNVEVIAVDQDPLGKQGEQIWSNCDDSAFESMARRVNHLDLTRQVKAPNCQQMWARQLFDGSIALLMVNLADSDVVMVCDGNCLGALNLTNAVVRDLWAHEDLGVLNTLEFTVNAEGGSRMFRLREAIHSQLSHNKGVEVTVKAAPSLGPTTILLITGMVALAAVLIAAASFMKKKREQDSEDLHAKLLSQ